MRINNLFFVICICAVIASGCKKEDEPVTPVINDPVTSDIILSEPHNNSTVTIYTPLLKWQQYQNSASYTVQISPDANFITTLPVDSTVSSLELNVPQGRLNTNVYYYWHVKADLGSGNFSDWSPVYRFRIILTPPLPPVLLLPQNNSVNQSFLPFFDWEESISAEFYRFQISANQSFSPVLFDSNNIGTSALQIPYFYVLTGTNYYWRVNASNSNGASTGDWSQPFTFRTADGPVPSSVSGTIRFTDNNIVIPPFYYSVAAFNTSKWPPDLHFPDYQDSLDLQFANNEYTANFTLRNMVNGSYHIVVFTTKRSLSFEYVYKSVYSCDTARVKFSDCPLVNPGTVVISSGNGVIDINMLSWADSTKTIF